VSTGKRKSRLVRVLRRKKRVTPERKEKRNVFEKNFFPSSSSNSLIIIITFLGSFSPASRCWTKEDRRRHHHLFNDLKTAANAYKEIFLPHFQRDYYHYPGNLSLPLALSHTFQNLTELPSILFTIIIIIIVIFDVDSRVFCFPTIELYDSLISPFIPTTPKKRN